MAFINNKKLGILGDGQLAKMLLASAHKMGVQTSIYSDQALGPAFMLAQEQVQGSYTNTSALKKWIRSCDLVTFESEFLDLSHIQSKKIYPQISIMNLLRDRLTQKQTLEKFKIPTSPFSLAHELQGFTHPLVFKKRLFGYDGYGTKITKSSNEFQKFLKEENELDQWIAEDFISFKRELAFSISRDGENRFCELPLVESVQKEAKCHSVKGPVQNQKLKPLIKKVKKMLTELDYVGLITFELFETKSGDLLVNEVAPRVHNSAHYSIEALHLSQFDVHILSLFAQKLPKKVEPLKSFAMVNLIGSSNSEPLLDSPQNGFLHWYGKKQNRPGRKMGHITVLDKSPKEALKLALKEEKRQKL